MIGPLAMVAETRRIPGPGEGVRLFEESGAFYSPGWTNGMICPERSRTGQMRFSPSAAGRRWRLALVFRRNRRGVPDDDAVS